MRMQGYCPPFLRWIKRNFDRSTLRRCLVLMCFGLLQSCVWNSSGDETDIPLDDSIYSYSGMPRLVVETEHFRAVNDVESYIPAYCQLYGEKFPLTDLIPADVKGRGNSSFTASKYGYRLELNEKNGLLEMPSNKDWVLIPNFIDRSLIRNEVTSKIAKALNDPWVPRSRFVELFFNRDYRGVFQLTERIKVGKKRVNIAPDAFLVEVDYKYKEGEQVFFSKSNVPFRIHYPKNISDATLLDVKKHIDRFEDFLKTDFSIAELSNWIDLEFYIRYYWIQEFSKNADGGFNTSVFFTWRKGENIKMGPIWDFDAAYGAAYARSYKGWLIRESYWNKNIFRNKDFIKRVNAYWKENKSVFESAVDSVETLGKSISAAADNNFLRWPILENDELVGAKVDSYGSYEASVLGLKNWMKNRLTWIDEATR